MFQSSSRQEQTPFRFWQFAIWLIAAMILSIVALPQEVAVFRPDFVLLVLIFWSLRMPAYLALVIAFATGLILDVLHFDLIGESSLAYLAAIFALFRWFMPTFAGGSLMRQIAVLFVLCLLSAIVSAVVNQMTQNQVYELGLWVQPLVAALISIVPLLVIRIKNQRAASITHVGC